MGTEWGSGHRKKISEEVPHSLPRIGGQQKWKKGLGERQEWERQSGWEMVKVSEMSEWGWGLKKEERVRRVQKVSFEFTLIKACVMDRTCRHASLLCVWGRRCEDGRGQASSRDVYCQQPEWDKDLNRNFKATSVSSLPPYTLPSITVLWLCDGQQALARSNGLCVCVCVILLFSLCYIYFLAVLCVSVYLCVVFCVFALKSRWPDAHTFEAKDLSHYCRAPVPKPPFWSEPWLPLGTLALKNMAYRDDVLEKLLLPNYTEESGI